MFKRCLILILGLAIAAPALAGGYGYGGRHYYGGHVGYHYHGGGDAGAALLTGLVFGGLIGYAINEDRHYYDRHYYRQDAYWDEPDVVYEYHTYRGPVYRDYDYRYGADRRYVRVVPQPVRVVETDPEFAGDNCQMTREYTTTIEVDGKKHDAYGTKCLAPNGSWILGRPKLVPDFN